MPRRCLAYLAEVVDACDAVGNYVEGVNLDAYRSTRSLRSAVEREFILIAKAFNSLVQLEPALGQRISHARRIVDLQNHLTYEYYAISDAAVWSLATDEVALVRRECSALIAECEAGSAGK